MLAPWKAGTHLTLSAKSATKPSNWPPIANKPLASNARMMAQLSLQMENACALKAPRLLRLTAWDSNSPMATKASSKCSARCAQLDSTLAGQMPLSGTASLVQTLLWCMSEAFALAREIKALERLAKDAYLRMNTTRSLQANMQLQVRMSCKSSTLMCTRSEEMKSRSF